MLGPILVAGVFGFRRTRDTWRELELAIERARTDFRNSRAKTVRNITRSNNRRAYERVYGDDELLSEYLGSERVFFYAQVAERATSELPRAVIDVGCGAGDLLRAVVDRAAPERVVGIDYASAGIRRASELVPEGEFHARSLYDLDVAETFDLVLCTEVLEHLRDPQRAMEVLVSLCARPGSIVITVPDGERDDWEGHRNFWNEAELGTFLRRYGEVEIARMGTDEISLLAVVRP